MFNRKQSNSVIETTRSFLGNGRLTWIAFALFSACIVGGCGTISSPSTTLSQHQPQPTINTQPFKATTQTFDRAFTITLEITPGRSGTNTFLANVMDNHANKAAVQITIILYITMQDMSMGTDALTLQPEGNGQFRAASDNLSMQGHWALGITIQTADQSIHRAGVSFLLSS